MPRPGHAGARTLASRALVAALAATTIAGCVESPTATRLSTRDLRPSLATSGRRWGRTRYPNAVKYRDTEVKPGKGRSGSASLAVRALLGKDGKTLVEVTTGTFDGTATAPGRIEKVQLKISDPAGRKLSTLNYRPESGGYASYTLAGLAPGSAVAVQANVSGIDRKRTDVVTATAKVALRPDLVVGEITGPMVALVGAPVDIAAIVREVNGHVGARANCVLWVDGAIVAMARGIWVDKLGDVSCHFRVSFPEVGTSQLAVSVSDVVPGDYDASNNTRGVSMRVQELPSGFTFSAGASDNTQTFTARIVSTQTYSASQGYKESSFTQTTDVQRFESQFQTGWSSGFVDRKLDFPATGFRVSVSHATNGSTLLSQTFRLAADPNETGPDGSCGTREERIKGNWGIIYTNICNGSWTGTDGVQHSFTVFNHQLYTAQVTYEAGIVNNEFRGVRWDDTSVEDTWAYNYEIDEPRREPVFGSDYTIHIEVEAADWAYVQDAVVPLTPFRQPLPDHTICTETADDWARFNWCYTRTNDVVEGIAGFVEERLGTVKMVQGVLAP